MEPLDIGPGTQWKMLLWGCRILFGGFGLLMVGTALFGASGGWPMLAFGLAFLAVGFGVPYVWARKAPRATLTAEGLDGPNLPERVAWHDIRGAEARVIPARRRTPEMRYVALDVPDADVYVGRASVVRRTMLLANKVYKLPPLSLEVGNLSMSPHEIAELVRERAAYAGPAA